MPAPSANPAIRVASVRMTPDERDRVQGVARSMGLSMSDLIRQGIARMEADYATASHTTHQ
jgi:hypothetical protein